MIERDELIGALIMDNQRFLELLRSIGLEDKKQFPKREAKLMNIFLEKTEGFKMKDRRIKKFINEPATKEEEEKNEDTKKTTTPTRRKTSAPKSTTKATSSKKSVSASRVKD